MKTLLVAEYREGRLQNNVNDLMAFANKAGADSTMFLVGSKTDLPQFQGKLYLADTEKCGEYNPEVHKELLLDVVAKVKPDMVIFSHSSYGWDLAPRVAFALKGEYGASRPVVDSEWAEHNRQIGTTGQTVSPKLYMACGISGAIQHLAGMKKSEFVVAINTDKEAPIGEMADILVVADLKQFIPLLTERILAL